MSRWHLIYTRVCWKLCLIQKARINCEMINMPLATLKYEGNKSIFSSQEEPRECKLKYQFVQCTVMGFELLPCPAQAAPSRQCQLQGYSATYWAECHQTAEGTVPALSPGVTDTHTHTHPAVPGSTAGSSWAPLKHQHCTAATTTSAKASNQLLTRTEKQMTYTNMPTLGLPTFLLKNSNKCCVLTKRELGCPCTSRSGHLTTLFWGKRKRSLNSILILKDHKTLITAFQQNHFQALRPQIQLFLLF